MLHTPYIGSYVWALNIKWRQWINENRRSFLSCIGALLPIVAVGKWMNGVRYVQVDLWLNDNTHCRLDYIKFFYPEVLFCCCVKLERFENNIKSYYMMIYIIIKAFCRLWPNYLSLAKGRRGDGQMVDTVFRSDSGLAECACMNKHLDTMYIWDGDALVLRYSTIDFVEWMRRLLLLVCPKKSQLPLHDAYTVYLCVVVILCSRPQCSQWPIQNRYPFSLL